MRYATPRPWSVSANEQGTDIRHVPPAGSLSALAYVSTAGARGRNLTEARENAQLIVCAVNSHDALLAACKAVMEFLSNGTPVHPGALVQAEVFNAICKAEGKNVEALQGGSRNVEPHGRGVDEGQELAGHPDR